MNKQATLRKMAQLLVRREMQKRAYANEMRKRAYAQEMYKRAQIAGLGAIAPYLTPALHGLGVAGAGLGGWAAGGGFPSINQMREPLARAVWDANYNPAEPVTRYDRQPEQTTTEYNEYLQGLGQEDAFEYFRNMFGGN